MVTFANAKINLGLNIVRRRPDGYHDLETIFYPAGKGCGTPGNPGNLCDIIEITPSDSDNLQQRGFIADCDPQSNLVMKALRLFREEAAKGGFSLTPQNITLEKHIPFGAGIGGGSADATATLTTLNAICGNIFDDKQLCAMVNRLGADCPFFVVNKPVFAQGTGELFTPLDLDLSDYWLALVKPDVSISTREAFSCVTPRQPEIPLTEIIRLPVDQWRDKMVNDFEGSVFTRHPELRRIKEGLYANGAVYASMSGSGSSFYGIFSSMEEAKKAANDSGCPYAGVTRMLR